MLLPRQFIMKLVNKDFGCINAGVIFFNTDSSSIQSFIHEWIKEITITRKWLIEQSSLVNLLKKSNQKIFNNFYNIGILKINNLNLKIKTFPSTIYNFYPVVQGYDDKKVKIIHFVRIIALTRKSLKHTISDIIIEIKFRKIYYNFLKIFPINLRNYIENIIELNLLIKLLVFPLNPYWIIKNVLNIVKNFKLEIRKLRYLFKAK